jgi:hypothetical protein
MWVELTCAEPTVAFRGEWPGPEEPDAIVVLAREKAMTSGLPVQIEIRGYEAWGIAPAGKVLSGRLFRPEKLGPSPLANHLSGDSRCCQPGGSFVPHRSISSRP